MNNLREKMRCNRWVLSILLLCCLSPAQSFHKQANKEMNGWKISQTSSFAGAVSLEFTDSALKMKVGRLGLTFIAKAPTWNALIYNDNTNNYVDIPYTQLQKRFTVASTSSLPDHQGNLVTTTKATGNSIKIKQFKALEYLVERKAGSQKGLATETELWIARDIKAPKAITQIFCSHLGIPIQKGIPLRVKHSNHGKMISVLETLAIERKTLPASLFESLKGYHKVKDEMALVMDVPEKEMSQELLDSSTKSDMAKFSQRTKP